MTGEAISGSFEAILVEAQRLNRTRESSIAATITYIPLTFE